MPLHVLAQASFHGISSIPHGWSVIKATGVLGLIVLLKRMFNGASNSSERVMHSKVVLMTGGTSGIGAQVARELASRGAQLVLLTQHPLSDPFLVDYIMDLRTQTGNELVMAEHVDLASLHSIRLFATKWIDNAPPRRLDMIVLCANTRTPPGGQPTFTEDGVESTWGINYLANVHLLNILSPALRAQPPDRDVRVLVATCSSYMGGKLANLGAGQPETPKRKHQAKAAAATNDSQADQAMVFTPAGAYAASKLALMTFAMAFQKHLSSYSRPDKKPMNARILIVDPGWSRTPGMRRWLSRGSLWGLALYLVFWPLWWLVLKSADYSAQTFLFAAMEARFGRGSGGAILKECREVRFLRAEVEDEAVQKTLWEASKQGIDALEKESALRRASEKKAGSDRAADGDGVPKD